MRKWYGQQSAAAASEQADEPQQQQQQPPAAVAPSSASGDDDADRDVVLVTDADSPTGELVVLQLILLRCGALAS